MNCWKAKLQDVGREVKSINFQDVILECFSIIGGMIG